MLVIMLLKAFNIVYCVIVSCHSLKLSHCAPKLSHYAPKLSHYAPKLSHYAPKLSHYAPKLSHYVPKLSHYAPKLSHYAPKLSHYAQLCSRSFWFPLCSKLCRHNWPRPNAMSFGKCNPCKYLHMYTIIHNPPTGIGPRVHSLISEF